MNNPILVTGASGFVGASIVRRLVHMGADVHVVLRHGFSDWRIRDIMSSMNVHYGSLEDGGAISEIVDEVRPRIIFHLAVYGAYPHQKDVNQMLHTNILGTNNLVNACIKHGFDMFINTGTSSEYGFKQHASKESEWLEPNSYYAVSKASATMYCSYTSKLTNLPIITFRLFSVYGAYEEPTRFIPTLIAYGLQGKLPPLVSPKTARDYVYIEDVVDAYLLAAQCKPGSGEVYNIGTGEQTTIEDVVNLACAHLPINTSPQWDSMSGRIWDTSAWVADIHKVMDELKWRPKRTFKQGFQETISWMKKNMDLYPYKRN